MSDPLTNDMIRVTRASIGAKGRAVRDRGFHVFVGHHALKDKRGRLRRFKWHRSAMGAARVFIAEHNQTCINPDCPKHIDDAAEHVDGACSPRENRLYERVSFNWGTYSVERFTGSIALPRTFTLDWPGHVNHGVEVFPVVIEGAHNTINGLVFVQPSQLDAADTDATDE